MATAREIEAMEQALVLAERGIGTVSPNPAVGCVVIASDGTVVGTGWHECAGNPHAEVMALQSAGDAARGATAVVTLEPCSHTGRTGPCTQALIEAGIARVVYAVRDPGALSGGGAQALASAGVGVEGGVLFDRAAHLNRVWLLAERLARPFVTVKSAASLDGRVAASDGSSRWITGSPARADAHRRRAWVDAVVVGSGTVAADDPALTVRDLAVDVAFNAPLRVVVGRREVPIQARVRGSDDAFLHLATHDIDEVLRTLWDRGVRSVLVEGGPTLVTAFLRHGVVDEVLTYVAPIIIGSGPSAIGDLGGTGIDDALRLAVDSIERLGEDVLIVGRPQPSTVVPPATEES